MCKDKQEPKPTTFDDLLENMREWNFEFIFRESIFEVGTVGSYISGATEKQSDENHRVMGRIRANLREDLNDEERWALVKELDQALSDSLHTDVPYMLFGMALGLRMAGVEVDDIRQRMKWLV